MKKLLLILTFLKSVLFSFNVSSEIINLRLFCIGELRSYENKKIYAKENNYKQVIEIKNNTFRDGKNLFDLEVSESFISKQIQNENNQLIYIFSLNRYTGEFWHFVAPTYTDGVYSLYFSGSCEKAKVKKF